MKSIVIANESYEDYVRKLQGEINEEHLAEIAARFGKPYDQLTPEERRKVMREYGNILPPLPTNARKRKTIRFKKQVELKPEFRSLWERISRKTRYSVRINTAKLIDEVIADLEHIHIEPPRIAITKATVDVNFVGDFVA